MEAHECICELIVVFLYDILVVNILRYRVVDIEQSNGVVRSAHSDVLRESTVDVNLASNRNATACQAAVYVARLEAELAWEGRPAFVGECYILARALVLLSPVKEC